MKPLIDEEAALAFALNGSAPEAKRTKDGSGPRRSKTSTQPVRPDEGIGKNMVRISLAIKKSLYERIAKDAARKDRTVDEHLRKHLSKHYGK
jgi:hypothetical protein